MNKSIAQDRIQLYIERQTSELEHKLRSGRISLSQYDAALRRVMNHACKLFDGAL